MSDNVMQGKKCQAKTLKGERCSYNGTEWGETHDGRAAWVCKMHSDGYIRLHKDTLPETPDVPKIGQTIKELRELRGWTARELQAMTGVKAETIREWEKGVCNPRIGSLHQVAQAFDASASDLLKDAGL